MHKQEIKILQINAANNLSTGSIMLGIAEYAREKGVEMYTASKYTKQALELENIRQNPWHLLIGSRFENTLNRYISWYTDFQDVGTYFGTKKLIKKIIEIDPDIIHLHDIVGWYIQIDILFEFLKSYGKPIVWTMHDCWAFTGRCIYYDMINCRQWVKGCKKCPQKDMYPYSKVFDHSSWNYQRKKKLFCGIDNLTIVTPSEWLANEIRQSFLKNYPIIVINNGINLDAFRRCESDFREKYGLHQKKILLSVASAWNERKGLSDLFELQNMLPVEKYQVVIVGLSEEQLLSIPQNIVGIPKTANADELAEIYSSADVLVNPTRDEVFGLVNIEALACGTPVVTYNTGGSPECIDKNCGVVVDKGDLLALARVAVELCDKKNEDLINACVNRAQIFDRKEKFREYYELYRKVLER